MVLNEIFFLVEEDVDGGYIARSLGEGIFTEADTIPELKANIREALSCHFDDLANMPHLAHLHFVKDEILTLVK